MVFSCIRSVFTSLVSHSYSVKPSWLVHQSLHKAYMRSDTIIVTQSVHTLVHLWQSRSLYSVCSSSATLYSIKAKKSIEFYLLAELCSFLCFAVPDQSKRDQDQERSGPPPEPDKVLPRTVQVSTTLIPLNLMCDVPLLCASNPLRNEFQNTPQKKVVHLSIFAALDVNFLSPM